MSALLGRGSRMDILTCPDKIYQMDKNRASVFLLSTAMGGICQPLYMTVVTSSFVEVGSHHRQSENSNVRYYMLAFGL